MAPATTLFQTTADLSDALLLMDTPFGTIFVEAEDTSE